MLISDLRTKIKLLDVSMSFDLCINLFHFPAALSRSSAVFSMTTTHLNTPLPTFKHKTEGDCPCICMGAVRACEPLCACACGETPGFLLMPVRQERLLLGSEFKRMCVTAASPLTAAAACDAPSHKSCHTFKNSHPKCGVNTRSL